MSIEQYENFIKSDPGNYHLWLKLGDLYHGAGRFDEAIASFEKCAMLAPENPVCISRKASVLISQHQFKQAERELIGLLKGGESSPELAHNLGLALFYQHRWEEAQKYFEQARENGLSAANNLDYLARSYHQQSMWDDAIKACEDWYALTGDINAQGYLAMLEMDRGHMDQALPIAERVLEQQPENVDAAAVVGTASIEKQDMVRAQSVFDRMIKNQPNNPRAWLGSGLVKLYQHQVQPAIKDLNKATQFMPDNAGTMVALGWAHIANKDFTRAEATFRKAVEIDRNFAEAQGGLASALVFQNKIDEAKEIIKFARRLNPQNFGGAFAQSLSIKLRGKDKAAIDIVARLLEQEPLPGAKPLIEHIQIFVAKNDTPRDQKKI